MSRKRWPASRRSASTAFSPTAPTACRTDQPLINFVVGHITHGRVADATGDVVRGGIAEIRIEAAEISTRLERAPADGRYAGAGVTVPPRFRWRIDQTDPYAVRRFPGIERGGAGFTLILPKKKR